MKATTIAVLIALALIAGSFIFSKEVKNVKNATSQSGSNVSEAGGKQIIEITAKGGYSPRVSTAKAGIPTVIKMKTFGTFDCSSALVIPSLNYRTNLKASGETEIEVPPQKTGTTLQGLCSMGMYNFSIQFN